MLRIGDGEHNGFVKGIKHNTSVAGSGSKESQGIHLGYESNLPTNLVQQEYKIS